MTTKKDDPDRTDKPEQGKEGGGANATSPHIATNDDPNGSPNPPTQKVPPGGVRDPYVQTQSGEVQESAPVWEGGDPGEAVQQDPATTGPDYVDTTYHPEDAAPEATAKSKKDAEDAAHIEKKKKDDFI